MPSSLDFVGEVERVIGYAFRDVSLLYQAFTRTSYCNEHAREGYQSNEVLEFFGDSVLSAALVSIFIRDYAARGAHGISTQFNEGELSVIKSNLSDKKNLSRSMRGLDLARYLIMGEGDKKEGVMREASVMEDLYESILGAVYIDSDRSIDAVIGVVERTLDTSIFLERRAPVQSYTGLLQEYCQDRSRRLPLPCYRTRAKTGPEHQPIYEQICLVGERVEGVGYGKSTKEGNNEAARLALESLRSRESESAPVRRRPDATPAYRLHVHLKQHPEIGVLDDLGGAVHPRATPTSPRYAYTYRVGDIVAEADAPSKSEAKQKAAQIMLEKLGICQ